MDDSAHGLQAGIFTGDVLPIWPAWRDIEVGRLSVDDRALAQGDHLALGRCR